MQGEMTVPTLPGFEILGKLGQGGMATVWLARQVSLDREVAVKVLLPRHAVSSSEVARFQSEAQAAARLDHPGIVKVYDAGVTGGNCFFVMEYIAGYTVGDWLRRKGILPEHDALLLAENVCEALGYAWKHARVIHCDIKPDNVMVDIDGTVKLTDLGLARTLTMMSEKEEGKEEEYVLGTPSYMSPEQAGGNIRLDFRADVYSLAAMLYHLVTGVRFFQDLSDDDALEQQITGTVPHALEVRPGLSKPLCCLLERMLAKDPSQRCESWREVQDDIRRVQSGLMPRVRMVPGTPGTMRPATVEPRAESRRLPRWRTVRTFSSSGIRTVLCVTAAVLAGVFLLYAYVVHSGSTPGARATGPRYAPAPDPHPHRVTAEEIASLRARIADADAWAETRPDDPEGSLRQYERLLQDARGTEFEGLLSGRVRRQQQAIRHLHLEHVRAFTLQVRALEAAGDYAEAVRLIESFGGTPPADVQFRQRLLQELKWHQEARTPPP